jgi:anti-sigma regulatory factor (Ser/Thr protein kinase)
LRTQKRFVIEDLSHVGEVRRFVNTLAVDFGFDETICGQISIVASELVTNIVKHATRGEVLCVQDDYTLSIIAIDRGPGIENLSQSMEDGYSTQGTAGNGLGAIKRLASRADFFTDLGKGSVIVASFDKKPRTSKIHCAGFSLPLKSETVSGDSWESRDEDQGETKDFKIMVADGLGHGLLANQASSQAVESFITFKHTSSLIDIQSLHNALRSTRGAAVAVAYINIDQPVVEYCGLGNIAGSLVTRTNMRKLVSYNGTAGHQLRKVQSLSYPMEDETLLIMHSDGISTHWNISDYPGLFIRDPLVIAAVLYRDFDRGNDDITVVVARRVE